VSFLEKLCMVSLPFLFLFFAVLCLDRELNIVFPFTMLVQCDLICSS